MRLLIWLVALMATAIGIAVTARFNPGNVVLFYPPHRIDMSLNLFVVLLVAGLVMNSGGPNPEVVHHGVVTVNFWLQIVLGAAIAVLLLLPPTHTWFREQKRLRRAAAADTAA